MNIQIVENEKVLETIQLDLSQLLFPQSAIDVSKINVKIFSFRGNLRD
jgi:hypothetical protein